MGHPAPPEALPQRRLIPPRNNPGQDQVFTPRDLAKRIIGQFPLDGVVLDACRGGGSFYDQYPDHVDRRWCDAILGRDFMDWQMPVDWIVTNPPWSSLREFLAHGMTVAGNVVFQMTLDQIFDQSMPRRHTTGRVWA